MIFNNFVVIVVVVNMIIMIFYHAHLVDKDPLEAENVVVV